MGPKEFRWYYNRQKIEYIERYGTILEISSRLI